jgi:hypothetical protein
VWRVWLCWNLHTVTQRQQARLREVRGQFLLENCRLQDRLIVRKHASVAVIIRRWRVGTLASVFLAWRKQAELLRAQRQRLLRRTLLRLCRGKQWRSNELAGVLSEFFFFDFFFVNFSFFSF